MQKKLQMTNMTDPCWLQSESHFPGTEHREPEWEYKYQVAPGISISDPQSVPIILHISSFIPNLYLQALQDKAQPESPTHYASPKSLSCG